MYDHNCASAGNSLFSYISMLFSFMSGVALPGVGFVLRIYAGNPPFFFAVIKKSITTLRGRGPEFVQGPA